MIIGGAFSAKRDRVVPSVTTRCLYLVNAITGFACGRSSRILRSLLHPFSVFRFSSEADKGSDYRAVTGGTARYLM